METMTYSGALPVEDSFDIVVAGGGPSGVAAAIAAVRLGREVALLEQTGCLGGMGTNGLVNVFMPCADDVRGLMGGVGLEILETLYQRGFLPPEVSPSYWQCDRRGIPFNGEGLKLVLDDLTLGAGVDVRFFTTVLDVISEGPRLTTLIVAAKERIYALRAPFVIDATGDATIAATAGFPFSMGDEDGNTQAGSLCSIVGNIDLERYRDFLKRSHRPGDWQRLEAPLEQAINDGVFSEPDMHLPGIFVWGLGYGSLNAGHLYRLNFLKDKDLTEAMVRGRKIAQQYVTFYRKYVEGCENMTHLATSPLPGVRETRRIIGEYILNIEDYTARRSFPDEIGRFNYGIDIHRSRASLADFKELKKEFVQPNRLGPGESYGIPYRSLIPRGSVNLLVAGRCISADRQLQGSVRCMAGCFITGHAAGAAAALCVASGITPQALAGDRLRQTLKEQGAYIP